MSYCTGAYQCFGTRAGGIMSEAFAPHKLNDATGLSVVRAKYKSAEDAAKGRAGKQYYIASLRVGKLREHGIEVVPRPEPDDPGHAELPGLNASNRNDVRTLELQRLLVQLTIEVQEPFGPFSE
jgi:hypothetical protein